MESAGVRYLRTTGVVDVSEIERVSAKFSFFDSIWNHITFMFLSVLQNCYFVNLSFKPFLKSLILKLVRLTCLDNPSYLQVSWILKQ